MSGCINPITIPNSDIEALANPSICFERKARTSYRSPLLVGIQKDQKGIERLVLINATICTIWNQICAFFGFGPLKQIDCNIKSVSQYIEKNWTQLSVAAKDDSAIQYRIKCIAIRGKIKGAQGLFENAPHVFGHRQYETTAAWQLSIESPSFVSSDFYNLHHALNEFPKEEFEETSHYFRQLEEIFPNSSHTFIKLKQFPREERAEAIQVLKSLAEKFPKLRISFNQSLFDLVFNTQRRLRLKVAVSLKDENAEISYKELEERVAYIEIICRTIATYPSDKTIVFEFIKCLTLFQILNSTYTGDCYNRRFREKRFKSFCQVVDKFLAFPKKERQLILDKLQDIVEACSPWNSALILSELNKIPSEERPSIIDALITIGKKVNFDEKCPDQISDLFLNFLKIPRDHRNEICIKLCQVLKPSTMMSYFNRLLGDIGTIPEEELDHVLNCIHTVFMQKKVKVYPGIYDMMDFFSRMPQEKIKSQADIYLFFKEMLYTPHRIDRVLTKRQFPFYNITSLTQNIPVDRRNSILAQLSPLHGKVGAFPLFSLFLVLSVMPEEEGKAFFETLTIEEWQEILTEMPNYISIEHLSDKFESLKDPKFDNLRSEVSKLIYL